MATAQIDFGNAEVKALNEAVAAGSFSISPDAAHQAKHQYDLLLTGLYKVRKTLDSATRGSGFGGLQSAQELQGGFNGKARDGVAVIEQLIDVVKQVQIGYLRAGKQLAEADQINALRLKELANKVQSGGALQ